MIQIPLTAKEGRILADYAARIEVLTKARADLVSAIISRTETQVGADDQISIEDGFLAVISRKEY